MGHFISLLKVKQGMKDVASLPFRHRIDLEITKPFRYQMVGRVSWSHLMSQRIQLVLNSLSVQTSSQDRPCPSILAVKGTNSFSQIIKNLYWIWSLIGISLPSPYTNEDLAIVLTPQRKSQTCMIALYVHLGISVISNPTSWLET